MILMPVNATYKTHTTHKPHIAVLTLTHQAGMTVDRVQSAQSSVRRFVRGNKETSPKCKDRHGPLI